MTVPSINDVLPLLKGRVGVVHYQAKLPSAQALQMAAVLEELQEENKDAIFVADVCATNDISLPLICVINSTGEECARVTGANPPALVRLIQDIREDQKRFSSAKTRLVDYSRLLELVESQRIMLFAKGAREVGFFCGFSKRSAALLNKYGASFGAFDVFTDPDVREGLKVFSNWPTFPQLYVDGEFIGGVDILEEMDKNGSLEGILKRSN